jgi:hypothetical protein
MTDLSKMIPADDDQALCLAIAMLHFPSIFITKKTNEVNGLFPAGACGVSILDGWISA